MNGVDPFVRHMLLCEDIRRNLNRPNKLDVLGLINTIQTAEDSTFPLHLPVLCIYLEIAAGRGTGQAQILCRQADSGDIVFSSRLRSLTFPDNPLAIRGLIFRMIDCLFPEPGLYWIQFCYNQRVIAEQPLIVR